MRPEPVSKKSTTTSTHWAQATGRGVEGGVEGGVEVRAESWTWQHADRSAPAVQGVDLHIRPGEKVLLAGPTGAGKSTLLHGLAGVLHGEDATSAGHLLLDGLPPSQARGAAGLMQQDPESQVILSRLGDDVAFAAENLAVPREEIWERVHRCLEAVGLGSFGLQHPTAQLSGGQKQRLALAGILAMRPGLLLLDEPTANLDPAGVTQIRDTVLAAAEQTGATVVVVEHRLEVWAEHMDTLLVLQPGGGVARRVPAQDIYGDQQLRQELAHMGLWVPGIDPLSVFGAAAGGATMDGAAKDGAAKDGRVPMDRPHTRAQSLLLGTAMAVSRHAPRPSWRRGPQPEPVLRDIDIAINQGEAVGITGPNGAGKSTLLLSLAGLLPLHGGTLRASSEQDADPHQWRPAELISRIGMVFQEPEHQFVTGSVAEELALGARQARDSNTDEPLFTEEQVQLRVEQLLDRLNLTELAQANPFTLSGGEKRRLSVGTALSGGADLLLLDEPTFGQDARTFTELIILLREHLDASGALCAVTHDEAFLRAIGARRYDVAAASGQDVPAAEDGESGGAPMLRSTRDTSWLGRRNALAKLIGLVLITLALVMSIDWVSSAVVIAASFLLLPVAGIRIRGFLARIWPFALGAVVAAWGTAIAGEETGRILLDLGFTTISQGSLELGIALGTRAFAIVLPSVIVFSTTDPTDLADSLAQQLKLPSRFVLGALAAMRLLGLLAEHWTTLGYARRARGLGAHGGLAARARTIGSQAFGLLVQAIRTATRVAITMESRGFGAGPRSWARPARVSGRDLPVLLVSVVIAMTAVTAAVFSGAWNFVWS